MRYVVPLAVLCLTLALFLVPRLLPSQFVYRDLPRGQTGLRVAVALPLLVSGVVLHFVRPLYAVAIIPPEFPSPRLLVHASGLCEIAGALGLALPGIAPGLRRLAGFCVALMLIAIFPANINIAGKTVAGITMPGVAARTAMQVAYMLAVLVSAYGVPGLYRDRARQAEGEGS